jgi:hypothetical protein
MSEYDGRLIYPSLADEPGCKPVRRIYVGDGYLAPIPAPDAPDEILLAFARFIADPWNRDNDYIHKLADKALTEEQCRREDAEGCVFFLPVRSGPYRTWGEGQPVPWAKWETPKELVDAHMERLKYKRTQTPHAFSKGEDAA